MASYTPQTPIQSMTGYGECSYEDTDVSIHVSLKTINSKYLDLDPNVPRAFAQATMAWRKLFTQHLKRGKVILTVVFRMRNLQPSNILDEGLIRNYGQFLKKMSATLDIQADVLTAALRLPGVVRTEGLHEVPDKIQAIATQTVTEALQRCVQSRVEEGNALLEQLHHYLNDLRQRRVELDTHIDQQKHLLRTNLQERLTNQTLTPQEWEQEHAACLSKASIEEEKVRFTSHLDFFQQTLSQGGVVGKKLLFILQELGRELNTMGAKAQLDALQHLVVDMKEVVEQMKEQVANLA